MRFPLSHRRTLCVTPKSPKGGSKREFLHLALRFISLLQVIVDTSNLIMCGLKIATTSNHLNFYILHGLCIAFCIFVIDDRKYSKPSDGRGQGYVTRF